MSVSDGPWAWTLAQPEGASGLVRALLESERDRRAGTFYETSVAADFQTMEVRTPLGGVTVLEMPGAGVMLLRDDERCHSFGYLADASGWRFTFGEDAGDGRRWHGGRPRADGRQAVPDSPRCLTRRDEDGVLYVPRNGVLIGDRRRPHFKAP